MNRPSRDELNPLFTTIFDGTPNYVGLFSGRRMGGRLTDQREQYLAYPATGASIQRWLAGEVDAGREVYICAHLLTDRRRKKEFAAPIVALWADGDTASIPTGNLAPTLVIESSPGRWQGYWKLTQSIDPAAAETLNKRIAALIGADASGFDLTQLLRVPGTPNRKYDDAPTVRTIAYHPDRVFDPETLGYVLPPPPVEHIRQAQPRDAGRGATPDDEPPIHLDAEALAVYQGHRPKTKSDGTGQIDRSASLLKIGRVLYNGGMTRRGLVAELAERDQALGYNKFVGRRDATEQYQRIVDTLEREDRRAQSPASSSTALVSRMAPPTAVSDQSCPAQLAEAQATIRRLRGQLAEAQETISVLRERIAISDQQLGIHRNTRIGSARAVGDALAGIFRERPPDEPDRPDSYRLPLGRLADLTGQSEDTCSRQIKQLGTYNLPDGGKVLHVQTRRIPRSVNPRTGEVIETHLELWAGPGVERTEFGRVLATLAPDNAPKHGGRADRGVCAKHPNAGVIRKMRHVRHTRYECAECGDVIASEAIPVGRASVRHVEAAPTLHDAPKDDTDLFANAEPEQTPTPHDAGSIPSVDREQSGKMRGRGAGGAFARLVQPANASDPARAAPEGSVTAAWMQGQALPGMAPNAPPQPHWDTDPHARAQP